MSSRPEHQRDPCPDRILDDVGSAFAMGAVGGSAFHLVKGLRNSPLGHRLRGGASAVRLNAPRLGGSFAVWGGLFSMFDCSFVYASQKEDPFNSIAAGAATGGLLALRQGARAAARSAAFGGVILALIEGAGIMINRLAANGPNDLPVLAEEPVGLPSPAPLASSGTCGSSWFGGIFGSAEEDGKSGDGGRVEVLEEW